jgi:hypothetical protein
MRQNNNATHDFIIHCKNNIFFEADECNKHIPRKWIVVFWIVRPCNIVRGYKHFGGILEAASTSEISVNFYQATWCNNPEDSHLQCVFPYIHPPLN